ncbi:MAG: hypothetical protein WB714_08495 [Candidatus Sulfotelmatobacter sp.]
MGSTVQCYARGTISNFAADRQRALDNAARAGAGVGSLAGVLITAWLNHRQEVKIETQELAKELQAYFDAEFDLLADEQKMEAEDQDSITMLEQLDSSRKTAWENQLAGSKKLYDMREKYISDLKGLEAMDMKDKHRKAMRYFIDNEPDGAKARYGRQRRMAAQCFVVNQFLKVLPESYRQNPPTAEEQKTALLIAPPSIAP